MKLLLTGSFNYTKHQLDEIRKLGYDIIFMKEESETIRFDVREIEVVVCNNLFLYHDINQFERLNAIQLTSAGLDRMPMGTIHKNRIKLFYAKDVYSIPIAEWVVLKILEIYKESRYFQQKQKEHVWEKNRELLELTDKKVGIIGYGHTGVEIAKRLRPFGVNIFAINRSPILSEFIHKYIPLKQLHEVLSELDIVILSIALTEETKDLLSQKEFDLMKEESVLVNVARGGLVNEADLISTLRQKKFLGVALDVFQQEPLGESPMWDFENVWVSPHNSFVSEKNNQRLYQQILENLKVIRDM